MTPVAKKTQPRLLTEATTPTRGPTAVPTSWAARMRDTAEPRWFSGKSEATADIDATSRAPAEAPCSARVRVNQGAESGRA